MTQTTPQPPLPSALPALLAFTAGFVDTCGFIALFGLFTAHVTGNFVLIGASLAEPRPGVIAKLLALPIFIVAVAGTRAFVVLRERAGQPAGRQVLIAQALLLLLFMVIGLAVVPITDPDLPLPVALGLVGVSAMAVQNAASRTVFASLSPTTVMTGNVTQLVIDAVDLLVGQGDRTAAASRLRKLGVPVMAFAAGALGGGFGFAVLGFGALSLPVLVVLALALFDKAAH